MEEKVPGWERNTLLWSPTPSTVTTVMISASITLASQAPNHTSLILVFTTDFVGSFSQISIICHSFHFWHFTLLSIPLFTWHFLWFTERAMVQIHTNRSYYILVIIVTPDKVCGYGKTFVCFECRKTCQVGTEKGITSPLLAMWTDVINPAVSVDPLIYI